MDTLATLTGRPASSFVLPSLAPDSVRYQSVLPLNNTSEAPVSASVPALRPPLLCISATLPASLLARRPGRCTSDVQLATQQRALTAARLAGRLSRWSATGAASPTTLP